MTARKRADYGSGVSGGEHDCAAIPSLQGSGGLLRVLRRHPQALEAGFFAYLLAFLILPAIHLLGHRADHVHGAQGEIVEIVEIAHEHGDGQRHTHQQQSDDAPAETPAHGQGSAAHLAAALTPTAVFVFVPLISSRAAPEVAPLRDRGPRARWLAAASARGPPRG